MDADRFDQLVARLTSGPSRRDALKGLVAGALTTAGLTSLDDDAAAKGKGHGKKRHGGKARGKSKGRDHAVSDEKKKKKCKGGKKRCNGKCRNIKTDPKNCGGCGIKCDSDQICVRGECESAT